MFSIRSISLLLLVALLGLGISYAPPVAAHEPTKNGEKPEAVPTTLNGIWHEVSEHQQELAGVIKNKQLAKVHEIAFHIRDLIYAMADKSTSLPAANLSKVKANSKFLATLAGRLDEAGDANDQARTEETYQQFSNLLKSIEAQYPADVLKYTGKE